MSETEPARKTWLIVAEPLEPEALRRALDELHQRLLNELAGLQAAIAEPEPIVEAEPFERAPEPLYRAGLIGQRDIGVVDAEGAHWEVVLDKESIWQRTGRSARDVLVERAHSHLAHYEARLTDLRQEILLAEQGEHIRVRGGVLAEFADRKLAESVVSGWREVGIPTDGVSVELKHP